MIAAIGYRALTSSQARLSEAAVHVERLTPEHIYLSKPTEQSLCRKAGGHYPTVISVLFLDQVLLKGATGPVNLILASSSA